MNTSSFQTDQSSPNSNQDSWKQWLSSGLEQDKYYKMSPKCLSSGAVRQECAQRVTGHAKRTQELPWWLSGKETACQRRRPRFHPNWRRKRQSTPVSLPGESHGQTSSVDCSPWGLKRAGHGLATKQQELEEAPLAI